MSLTRHGACGGAWWQSGNRTGHCSACHRNFDGIRAFDRHRRDGQCLDDLIGLTDEAGRLVFTHRFGSHDVDAEVVYWRLTGDPLDPSVFRGDK